MNFENIYNALLTLFVVTTLEGWPDIMLKFVDGDSIENGPSKNAS